MYFSCNATCRRKKKHFEVESYSQHKRLIIEFGEKLKIGKEDEMGFKNLCNYCEM